MSKQQRMYKIDVNDLQEQIALAHVTNNLDVEASCRLFCDLFSISLNEAKIKADIAKFEVVAQALNASKNK